MGEAKRRREYEAKIKSQASRISSDKCSAKRIAVYCCIGDPWKNLQDIGEMGFRVYGEPLMPEVIEAAEEYKVDPHDLDYHVEGCHGWEPHNDEYQYHVWRAAECMLASGYRDHRRKDVCADD